MNACRASAKTAVGEADQEDADAEHPGFGREQMQTSDADDRERGRADHRRALADPGDQRTGGDVAHQLADQDHRRDEPGGGETARRDRRRPPG